MIVVLNLMEFIVTDINTGLIQLSSYLLCS